MDQIHAAKIAYFNMFEVLPNTLIRIKFRCIGWKVLQVNLCCPTVDQKRFYFLRAMDDRIIPDHQQGAAKIPIKVT